MRNKIFNVEIDNQSGGIKKLVFCNDKHELNWIDGVKPHGVPYGKYSLINQGYSSEEEYNVVYSYNGLKLDVARKLTEGGLINKYVFSNNTSQTLIFKHGDLGITMPFNDNYEASNICLTKKCHMHIWSALNVGYIACKRMNGEANNLGVLLAKGSVLGYAIEREWNSNDRGDLSILLPPCEIKAGESVTIEFVSFVYDTFTDFYAKCLKSQTFMNIKAPKYALSVGETIKIKLETNAKGKITSDVGEIIQKDNECYLTVKFDKVGETKINIGYGDNLKTYAEFYVYSNIKQELDARLKFIVEKQQLKTKGKFDGAIMLYDNSSNKQFIVNKVFSNKNFARERMCMTTSMLERLIIAKNNQEEMPWLEESAKRALAFVDRAFVKDNGKVYDMPNYKRFIVERLYNYSWAMMLYITAFECFGDVKYLNKACSVAKRYYKKGGEKFYAILLPFQRIYDNCISNQCLSLAEEMKSLFLKHGDKLVQIGCNYPAHEVKYEQSIVAPSVDILLECYNISGDRKYLDEAERQLPLLEAFNGAQPSFHMNQVSIRHWDGFWFGKSKMYGDTFPHYWSCISAMVFKKYSIIKNDLSYAKKADVCLSNNLSLIQNGKGSCAYIYPSFINGQIGGFYDVWANDQDWAIWFNLKYNSEYKKS